ncbi:thioredoxin [Candidatus Uhrbacteria bacterium]|nr:thioredoxin [Candidatus Uhrbacteria bacterium]
MSIEVNDANFDREVLESEFPVLVDFWAPWCGPCREMGPILDRLSEEMKGQPVRIVKVNVDENPGTPGRYGVMSIPTLMIFRSGQPVDQMVGIQPKEVLAEKLGALM